MSSRKASTIFQVRPRNTKFMTREKVVGAFHSPNPIQANSYRPNWVTRAVLLLADPNLVKGGASVQLGELHGPREGVHALICKRQWKYVFPGHIIQAPVVQAPPDIRFRQTPKNKWRFCINASNIHPQISLNKLNVVLSTIYLSSVPQKIHFHEH